MITSVSASEFLAGYPAAQRARQMSLLERHFYVPPLDAPAATLAATLFDNSLSGTLKTPGWRQRLKSDTYIISTAIIHGAKTIVTSAEELPKFVRLAGSMIKVIEVPTVPKQTTFIES